MYKIISSAICYAFSIQTNKYTNLCKYDISNNIIQNIVIYSHKYFNITYIFFHILKSFFTYFIKRVSLILLI